LGDQNNVGDVLLAQGDIAAALTSYQAAFAIADRSSKSDPTNTTSQRDQAISYRKLGEALAKKGDRDAAVENFRAALAIASHLIALDPTNLGWQGDYNAYDWFLATQGDDAVARYTAVMGNLKKLKSERELSVEQATELDQAIRSIRLHQQAMPRQQAAIDPSALDDLVGSYRLAWNSVVVVTRDGDRLFAKGTDKPIVEIFPESDREFFVKVAPVQLTFVRDRAAPASAVVVHANGYDMTAEKVETATEQARMEALARRIQDDVAAAGSEAALRHAIEAVERGGQPDYDQLTDTAAQVVRQVFLSAKKQLTGSGVLQTLTFVSVDPDGADEYVAQFARARIRYRIILARDGKIDLINFKPEADAETEDRRLKENTPAPGSDAALRDAIESTERGAPNFGQMSEGLLQAVLSRFASIQRNITAFGELKSLTFKQVAPWGAGDDYVGHFANADVQWRILMRADGKIDSLYYIPPK
jgi:tetratricopeptide (TPR) repeat protein